MIIHTVVVVRACLYLFSLVKRKKGLQQKPEMGNLQQTSESWTTEKRDEQ